MLCVIVIVLYDRFSINNLKVHGLVQNSRVAKAQMTRRGGRCRSGSEAPAVAWFLRRDRDDRG